MKLRERIGRILSPLKYEIQDLIQDESALVLRPHPFTPLLKRLDALELKVYQLEQELLRCQGVYHVRIHRPTD